MKFDFWEGGEEADEIATFGTVTCLAGEMDAFMTKRYPHAVKKETFEAETVEEGLRIGREKTDRYYEGLDGKEDKSCREAEPGCS